MKGLLIFKGICRIEGITGFVRTELGERLGLKIVHEMANCWYRVVIEEY